MINQHSEPVGCSLTRRSLTLEQMEGDAQVYVITGISYLSRNCNVLLSTTFDVNNGLKSIHFLTHFPQEPNSVQTRDC